MSDVERAVGAEDASNNGDVVGSMWDERGAVWIRTNSLVCDARGNPHTWAAERSGLRCSDCGALFTIDWARPLPNRNAPRDTP